MRNAEEHLAAGRITASKLCSGSPDDAWRETVDAPRWRRRKPSANVAVNAYKCRRNDLRGNTVDSRMRGAVAR
jgi:hypothetical protein